MSRSFSHDIFISYRYNDNRSGWVTTFVDALREELAATLKDPVSIYFDANPTEGLKQNHDVDRSLAEKIKCLILVPILSQTYCDARSFAWQNEFAVFNKWVRESDLGSFVTLHNGNVASRILPVRIHDLDHEDEQLYKQETGQMIRSVDFIFKSSGVNRPLRANEEHPHDNINNTIYRDQINKLANAIKDIIISVNKPRPQTVPVTQVPQSQPSSNGFSADELSMDEKLLQKLHKAVEENLSNELFSVEDLADEVAYSRSYLHRKLQRLRGVSISQFIRAIRLQHGYELLKKDVGTVSEIAYRVGFSSNTYFTKCFREHFGYSPGEVKVREAMPKASPEQETVVMEAAPDVVTVRPSPLEALHPAASETLIREIFDELARHKPELEKFLIVDEEVGESVDSRLLAYQIIKSYPYPVGIELRRLFSGNLLARDRGRFNQLQLTIGRCAKLLAFILTCELTDHINAGRLRLDREASEEISAAFQCLDIGNLTRIMELSSRAMQEAGCTFFVEELSTVFDLTFFREMNEVVKLIAEQENEYATFEERYAGLEQALILILKKLSFLVRYRLVNVDAIEVNKSKYKPASFEHRLHILNSTDAEFKAHQELLAEFSDSRAVLLMKSFKDPNQFLNLSPLVIDTHSVNVDSKEKINLKRDIYLFDGSNNSKLTYTGVESCIETDLSFLEKYDALVEEYNQLLTLITQR